MTLIKKLINKFKKKLIDEQSQEKKERVVDQFVSLDKNEKQNETKVENDENRYYQSKNRENALNFQDECNNELFWNDQGC